MDASAAAPRFSIGRTLKDSLKILARNFVTFVILAAVIRLLLLISPPVDPRALLSPGQPDWWGTALQLSLGFIVAGFTKAFIVFGTFQNLRGEKASIAKIWPGIRFVPLVIAASAVVSLPSIASVITGNLFHGNLVVIGISGFVFGVATLVLILMWWVCVPAIVAEGAGLLHALGRSRYLMRNRRWHVFGLLLVVGVVSIAIGFAVAVIGRIPMTELATVSPMTPVGSVIFMVGALVTAFSDVLVTVVYHHLRIEKEGGLPETIIQVFD